MLYVAWILGSLLAVLFATVLTVSIEKTGRFDE